MSASFLHISLLRAPLLCAPVLCATLVPCSAFAQPAPAGFIAQIEAPQSPQRQGLDRYTLLEIMQKYHVPGVSIAVISNFGIHWAKSYGIADVESGAAVAMDTLFQAASISKPVTAMAALKLQQEGRFNLDADINDILTSWKVPPSEFTRLQPVTARSLLSHTSGADDGFGFPGYHPALPRPTAVQVIAGDKSSNVGPVTFARTPFAGYKYSGGGITIMQLALTDRTGKAFADLMRESVLAPLNMSNSTYEQPLPAALGAKAARAHNGQGKALDAKWHVFPEQAAAGLWTTPSDLARYVLEIQQALRTPKGHVLSQSSAREMITPVGTGDFAVGLRIGKRGEGWYFTHGGSNWGFRCDLLAHIRKGYGVVVMTNSDSGTPLINEIEARVAAAYGWDSLDKEIPR